MSKLIDTEKLARLAKALDDRAKAAVAAEEQRARAAEEAIDAKADANAAAIEAINHAENGILAQAKAFVNEEIGKVNEAMEEADNGLSGRLDVLEGIVIEDENGLGKMQENIAANKAAIDKLNGGVDEEGSVAKAIKDAVDPVQGEVDAVEGRMDAAEGRLNALEAEQDTQDAAIKAAQDAADKAQGEVDAVEGRMDAVEAEQLVQNQDIANNKAAIDKLNGGADEEGSVAKSIADALEPYSTTEEMKVILGNVVNSLALTMENDKVVLKLGGVEGVAITEVSLDMATDADIDAIVSGLDAE